MEKVKVSISFTVYGKPVAKGRARVTIRGGFARAYTPDKTVRYEKLIAHEARLAMLGKALFEGPVSMMLSIYLCIPRAWNKKKRLSAINGDIYPITKPDSDNICKGVSDALNGIIYKDDSQIVDHLISKRYCDNPRIEVIIKERIYAE